MPPKWLCHFEGSIRKGAAVMRRPSICASKPVSRVLSFKTAIYLDAPLPVRSSRLPGTAGPASCPSTALLRIEFTAMDASTPSGELLPRLSTLTSTQAGGGSPAHTHPQTGEAVSLCCTFPGVAPGGCYPLSLPCGARTFLTPEPFASGARLPSLLAEIIVTDCEAKVKSRLGLQNLQKDRRQRKPA